MGISDGTVLGTTMIVNNGSPAQRWNLVIIGDGYRDTEMATYASDAQNVVNALFAAPPFSDPAGPFFASIREAVNVHRIDVASDESGADDPAACGGSGAIAATYFDASFCNSGIRRLLLVNNATAIDVADAEVPEWHAILCLVNSSVYGGGGGAVATASRAPGALEIALHELGHSAFGLADEYEYWAGCGIDTDRDNHPPAEPSEPNVTTTLMPLKWAAHVTPGIPIPTTSNPDCSLCDTQPNPHPAGTVGAYEGAHYFHCDAWRPQFYCKMRNLNQDWCAVCRDRIRHVLGPYRPTPPWWIIFERFEVILERRFRIEDWVVDPAPFDISRYARRDQYPARPPETLPGEDELSALLENAGKMGAEELRSALFQIRGQVARLEAAVSVLENSLKNRY